MPAPALFRNPAAVLRPLRIATATNREYDAGPSLRRPAARGATKGLAARRTM